jgi:hypothetical protein
MEFAFHEAVTEEFDEFASVRVGDDEFRAALVGQRVYLDFRDDVCIPAPTLGVTNLDLLHAWLL